MANMRHTRKLSEPYQMTGIDPRLPFTVEDANVENRITNRTLPTKRSLCAAASLDRYYREQLDRPIPALENVSPRQAIKTAQGCEKVVGWLKRLENLIAQQNPSDPMADYETTWLWDELGLRDRRF